MEETSTQVMKPQNDAFSLILFILFIALLWIGFGVLAALSLASYTYQDFGLGELLISGLPTFYYLKYWEKVSIVDFLKLHKITRTGIYIVIAFALFWISLRLWVVDTVYGSILFNYNSGSVSVWIGLTIISFIEEVVYRGVILQKSTPLISFWPANILSCFLQLLSSGGLSVYVAALHLGLGLTKGYVFKKSGSLWPCILISWIVRFMALLIYA